MITRLYIVNKARKNLENPEVITVLIENTD